MRALMPPRSGNAPAFEGGLDALPQTAPVVAIKDALRTLPAGPRPDYASAGTLGDAAEHPLARGPGLYLILFTVNGRPRAYSGLADDLRIRLQQHRRCARSLGVALDGHQVLVAPMPRASVSAALLRLTEKRIHSHVLGRHAGLLTNLRTELATTTGVRDSVPQETTMHATTCQCSRCRAGVSGAFETLEFGASLPSELTFETEASVAARDGEGPFSEADEIDLALELLSVSSEDELDQFLGKLVRGAWKGIKKVGSAVGKIAKPLGGVLKGLAKQALPFVGGALGSLIPIPGVGTALGRAVGSAVSQALEAEVAGLEAEERDLEMARRFVRIAGSAAQQAARAPMSGDPQAVVRSAVLGAARQHLPGLGAAIQGGRWERRGNQIVIVGA